MEALRRWWQALWGRGSGGAAGPVPVGPEAAPPASGAVSGDDDARRVPGRRHYTAPRVADDPRREAHLGAVLEALAGGPLRRDELGRRVTTDAWGPGRLDAVVDHGVATHVLVEGDDGTVRARYAD